MQIGEVGAQFGMDQALQAQLVQGVGRVREELSEEDVLVGIDRVDDQVQQLAGFGLEFVGFDGHEDSGFNDGIEHAQYSEGPLEQRQNLLGGKSRPPASGSRWGVAFRPRGGS